MTTIKCFIGILLLLLLSTCDKEITNPFDPDCPKEIWTPSNFLVVQAENKLDLTWKQDNGNISGFKIERKVGTEDWSNVASPGKTALNWSDTDLKGGELHQYRLCAYAGDNFSNTVTAQATPVFTASLTTTTQSNLSCNSAVLGGNISNTGGATITECGIVYAKIANPTTSDTKIIMGNGQSSYSLEVTGLEEKTTYYVRAYAINSAGTSYGNHISFTTPACAVEASVTTSAPTNISCTSATLGGNVTDDKGATVTERGIVYSKTENPAISDTKKEIGNGTGPFSQEIAGLEEETTYYVRAYTINSAGTSYGNQVSFETPACAVPPTVTTSTPVNISCSSATLGGSIIADGGSTVTECGIVYSKTENPVISDNKKEMGNGTGIFSQEVTGLEGETTYYIRAYASNSAGTSYGNQVSFTTPACDVVPTVTTRSVTDITPNSARMGGNITFDGNAPITECGVVYSILEDPTIADNKFPIGSGIGAFAFGKIVTGLTENTTYYVRAYAINSQGTAYGNQVTFKTKEELTGNFTDERDGKTYKWVKIGDQIWMAENLAYLPYLSTMPADYAPNQEILNTENPQGMYYVYQYWGSSIEEAKTTYAFKTSGVLYTHKSAITSCPSGWHLASNEEWDQLAQYVSDEKGPYKKIVYPVDPRYEDYFFIQWENVGVHLKSTSGWLENNGLDDFGFTAYPGGSISPKYNEFDGDNIPKSGTRWWTSTPMPPGANEGPYFWILDTNSNFENSAHFFDSVGLSVRCVKD